MEQSNLLTDMPIVPLTIDWVVLVASIPGNVFIVVVNLLDCIGNQKCNITDRLILSISIVNLLHGVLKVYKYIFLICKTDDVNSDIRFVIYMLLLSTNLWFCTLLCLHFCLKIVKINIGFYVLLQRRFFKMFPWLHSLSVLGSLIVSVPFAWFEANNLPTNITQHNAIEQKTLDFMTNRKQINVFHAHVMLSTLGFVLCSASVVTIISSLYGHVKRMRLNSEGSTMPTMKAHVHAAKTAACLLLHNIFTFIVLVTVIFDGNDLAYYIFNITTSFFSLICSLNLIKGNTKLDKALTKTLAWCPFRGVMNILR